MPQADLIIIGGGPGGYETAAEATARGLKTILFERNDLGGTCLNRGCIPTKCLCASARRLDEVRSASELGIEVPSVSVNFASVKARMTEVVSQLREGIQGLLAGTEIIRAEARLAAGPVVIAGDTVYTAPRIIIATGSKPARLRAASAETALDSDAVLSLEDIPESMVIIGGGVIGLEFASVFNSFGSRVTVLEYCKEILPGFDRDIARRLRSALSRRGVDIVTGAEVSAVEDGRTVRYTQKGREVAVEAACTVAAVGRRPVLPEGLDEAGVELDNRGFIKTGRDFSTTAPGVYAIGDVNGRCMLAHAASAQGRVVLGMDTDLSVIPAVVFTDPECAMVGETSDNSDDCVSVKIPFGANGKALASAESEGLLKMIVSRTDGRIKGCHAIGPHSAELIAEVATAMQTGVTAETLAFRCVHAHPTVSELLATAAATACAKL